MNLIPEIETKLHLYLEGIRIDKPALEGVGTKYKENITYVFDYNYDFDPGVLLPLDFKLPLGTICRVCYNERSPYLVKKADGALFVEKDGKFVTTIDWIRRPKFYDQLTSDGIPMEMIGQVQGECCFTVCFTNSCLNWKGGNQCRYCNIDSAQKDELNRGKVLIGKKPDQVGEVAAAWMEEVRERGLNFHSILVAGTLPGTKASEVAIKITDTVRHHTGLGDIPGWFLNIAPPLNLTEIDQLHKAGVKNVAFNLEAWAPDAFKEICPGKHKNLGREVFLRALEHAVPIFGRGHVCSVLVCGLEEKENYFEAAEYLAQRGVWTLPAPWKVMKGSKLEGHRSPHPEWHLEVNERVIDIMAEAMPEILSEEFFKSGNVTCYRCQPLVPFWDILRNRLGGIEIPMGKDKDVVAA